MLTCSATTASSESLLIDNGNLLRLDCDRQVRAEIQCYFTDNVFLNALSSSVQIRLGCRCIDCLLVVVPFLAAVIHTRFKIEQVQGIPSERRSSICFLSTVLATSLSVVLPFFSSAPAST